MAIKYSQIEVKLGFFVAVCLGVFVAMLVTYGKLTPMWRGRQQILVAFDDINGLRPDAPVLYNGYEVGRVKSLRVLHLDDENMERLRPWLTRANLDNLPLRSEALKRELRGTREEDFAASCRAHLQNHTMVEVCLEVLHEGDSQRYRIDDQVRIVSTMLGDTAVEIISGNGAINQTDVPTLLLGNSADFFSNLAKSMGDVKEILSSVTDVVGTSERQSLQDSQTRFKRISERMDKLTTAASQRADFTAKKFGKLSDDVTASLKNANELLERIQPKAKDSNEQIKASLATLKQKAQDAQEEVDKTGKDISVDMKKIQDDIHSIVDSCKDDFEPSSRNLKQFYEHVGGLSVRLDSVKAIAGWAGSESDGDLERGKIALKNSLANLQIAGAVANENKDLMISRKDTGEHEYNTAVSIYHHMSMALRRICGVTADLQDAVATIPDANPAFKSAAQTVVDRLAVMRAPLEDAVDTLDKKMLPEFERKKAAWTDR